MGSWSNVSGLAGGAKYTLAINELHKLLQENQNYHSQLLLTQQLDPLGEYVKRWVSELERVPVGYIHSPWLMCPSLQQEVVCVIGQHYPSPVHFQPSDQKPS